MTAITVFLCAWAILAAAPDTPTGRLLHRLLVEIPGAAAGRLRRIDVVVMIVIASLVVLHLSAGDADPVRMLGLLAPDLALWLTGLEIGAVLEGAAFLTAAWAAARRLTHVAFPAIRLSGTRPESRVGRTRCGRRTTHVAPANDDDDGTARSLAS